jgi:NitT/TauT family transport system substrate-binding protein
MWRFFHSSLHRRRWLQWGASTAGAYVLAGCKQPVNPLRVGSLAFPGYEPLFVAREQGWLNPDQVRLVEMHSNADTLRALTSGRLEAGQITLDEFLTLRAGGLDVRILAVLDISEGADVIMARPGLRLPLGPQGLRIAMDEGTVGAIVLARFLAQQGLAPSDVRKTSVPFGSHVAAYRQGMHDLIVTAEPWATEIEASGGTRIFDSRAIPGQIVDVLVARTDTLTPFEPGYEHLVQSHFRALRWMATHPEEAARIMAPRLQIPEADVPATFRGLRQPDAAASRLLLQAGSELDGNLIRLARMMRDQQLMPDVELHGPFFEPRFHPPVS